jgi:putative hydrolase of the HAD superfamily
MTDSAEHESIISLIKQNSPPLLPIPAELPPEWEALASQGASALERIKPRAFMFDLYGTLFVSNAGEIAAHNEGVSAFEPGTVSSSVHPQDAALNGLRTYFRGAVGAAHTEAQARGVAFPEIRVETIWAAYDGPLPAAWTGLSARRPGPREIALCYETAVNPVYPMPGVLETLAALRERGAAMGIISNAQFFSPLLFEAFFGQTLCELGFDSRLLVWSFELGEAKPSIRLFENAKNRLKKLGIAEKETLYTGNDMRNDIIPASLAGFTTALFAGDRRSLRLRDAVPAPNTPAAVARDLQFIAEIR